MQLEDYQIVNACLAGDEDAFSEIVTRYKRLIYTVVYRMIHDQEETRDISQEAFIKIYRSLDRYDAQYKFSTWAVKIATNLCLDVLRKKKLNRLSVDEMVHMPSHDDTPEIDYLKTEKKQIIKAAIDSLPEKYKVPVILFHEQGLSYNEICKVLDEPLSIVKNRLHRARHMLRDKLMHLRKEEAL